MYRCMGPKSKVAAFSAGKQGPVVSVLQFLRRVDAVDAQVAAACGDGGAGFGASSEGPSLLSAQETRFYTQSAVKSRLGRMVAS